jgi:UDP-glucose 4-epimerase
MNKNTILLTGGLGFIGSHTAVELINAGYNVIIADNLENSKYGILDNIKQITGVLPKFEFVDCKDLSKLDAVFNKYKIDGIIHFAANKCVGESVNKPLKYYNNNLVSLINVMMLMEKYKINNIVFSSSCTIYGQPKNMPVTENTPIVKANCPYGNTKQISEEIIIDTINANNNINSIILRYFNPIGAHPSGLLGELPIGEPQNLIPYITQTAIGIRKQLKVFGNNYNTHDGSCVRDYIDICDLAKAHVMSMTRLINNENDENVEIFNLSTGRGLSVLEIINLFEEATGETINYNIVDRRSGDVESIYGSCYKANNVLGWNAETDIRDTLLNAWKWEKNLVDNRIN